MFKSRLNTWDSRFMEQAKLVSTWSKDPSTQTGAIAVRDRRVLSMGYNGFPRGIEDTKDRLNNREDKYRYVVHAEMNAIYNATLNGVSLDKSSLYVYGLPVCSSCAKGIIQVGIVEVFILTEKKDMREIWLKEWEFTKSMFDECGIQYYWYKQETK